MDRTAVLGGPFDYAYDAAGNLRSVEYPAGSEWSWTYDVWNRHPLTSCAARFLDTRPTPARGPGPARA